MSKDMEKAWEVKWFDGRAVTYFEKRGNARYFEQSVKDTDSGWVSTKLAEPLPGARVRKKKIRVKAQQREHTYHGTTRDVPGTPLPAFQEPYIFPRYNTEDVRELSLLQLVPDIAETIVSIGVPWQDTFDQVLMDMDANEFSEVRRRVFQLLPAEVQADIVW